MMLCVTALHVLCTGLCHIDRCDLHTRQFKFYTCCLDRCLVWFKSSTEIMYPRNSFVCGSYINRLTSVDLIARASHFSNFEGECYFSVRVSFGTVVDRSTKCLFSDEFSHHSTCLFIQSYVVPYYWELSLDIWCRK